MTEIKEITMPQAIQQFILYWGDMGSQWGVNRSVAQIHALLYLSASPMNAEQITDTLGIAPLQCFQFSQRACFLEANPSCADSGGSSGAF